MRTARAGSHAPFAAGEGEGEGGAAGGRGDGHKSGAAAAAAAPPAPLKRSVNWQGAAGLWKRRFD